MTNKELEIEACKRFPQQDVPKIDEACDRLKLSQETKKLARGMADRYLKLTYHAPPYASFKALIGSFVYLAADKNGEHRDIKEILLAINPEMKRGYSTPATITSWNKKIRDLLHLREPCDLSG